MEHYQSHQLELERKFEEIKKEYELTGCNKLFEKLKELDKKLSSFDKWK